MIPRGALRGLTLGLLGALLAQPGQAWVTGDGDLPSALEALRRKRDHGTYGDAPWAFGGDGEYSFAQQLAPPSAPVIVAEGGGSAGLAGAAEGTLEVPEVEAAAPAVPLPDRKPVVPGAVAVAPGLGGPDGAPPILGVGEGDPSSGVLVDPTAAPPEGPVAAPALPGVLAQLDPPPSSAADIDRATAEVILEAGGYYAASVQRYRKVRGDRFQKGLRALAWGYTFRSQRQVLGLDSRPRSWRKRYPAVMRDLLFREYQLMTQALPPHTATPTISRGDTPEVFQQFVAEAAAKLKMRASESHKARLLRSQLWVESKQVHWTDFAVTRSFAGAGGFGQIMPGHMDEGHGKGKNYFSPQDGFDLQVTILNNYLRKAGGSMHNALAMYNGGPGLYRRKGPQSYARMILAGVGRH